jgi:hypothetical protein
MMGATSDTIRANEKWNCRKGGEKPLKRGRPHAEVRFFQPA